MTKKKRRKRYTDEFKAEVLRAVETRGQRTIGKDQRAVVRLINSLVAARGGNADAA